MKLPSRYFGKAHGRHRAEDTAPQAPIAIVQQQFVRCGRCGGVESAATRHGQVLRCAEGHVQPIGGAA